MKRLLPVLGLLAFVGGLALLYFGTDLVTPPGQPEGPAVNDTTPTENPPAIKGEPRRSTEPRVTRPTPPLEESLRPPIIPTRLENGAPETILRGCVLNPAGNPVRGGLISLLRVSDEGLGASGPRIRVKDTLATDSKGCFRFDGLTGGKGYIVIVEAGEYAELEYPSIEAPGKQETVLPDLHVVSGVDIRGTVRNSEQKAVPRATVALFSLLALAQRDTPIKQVLTQDDGSYGFPNIAPGTYQVTVGAAGYQNARSKNLVIELGKPPQVVDFVMSVGRSVKGRVTGVDDKPIDGVLVEARGKGRSSGVTARTTTRSDGLFSLEGLGDAELRIEAKKAGYSPAVHEIVKPDANEFLNLRLLETAGISGTLVDAATKKPLQTFGVMLLRVGRNDTPNEPLGGMHPVDFSADGSFTIDDVPPGRYLVQGFADGYGPTMTRPFDVKRLYIQGVTVEMKKGGRLTGIVLDTNGSPLEGATVRMFRNEYTKLPISKLLYGEFAEVSKPQRTDAQGRFEFENLGPSIVQLRVTAPDHTEVVVKDITCDSGREVEVGSIALGRGGHLSGHVVEAGGLPARAARVLLMGKNGESQETKTGSDGSFSFRNLTPGEFVVSASKTATDGSPENPLLAALASQKSMQTANVVEGGTIAVDIVLADLK